MSSKLNKKDGLSPFGRAAAAIISTARQHFEVPTPSWPVKTDYAGDEHAEELGIGGASHVGYGQFYGVSHAV